MARKQSAVEKLYNKERRRIDRQIKRLEKRGYIDLPELPGIPKRITSASIRRIQRYNNEYLYSKSRYVNTETGEIFTGKQGRVQERKASAAKAAQTRKVNKSKAESTPVSFTFQVLAQFQREMSTIFSANPRLLAYIKQWFDAALARYGRDDFAEALSEANERGEWPGYESISDEERLIAKLTAIITVLAPSKGSLEDFMSEMEEMEEWVE